MCICVDDFGLSKGVNAAVLTLAAKRRVHATSCMVFAPHWTSGSSDLKSLGNEYAIDIGLHLDFTQHPSRPGMRHSLRSLILQSLLGQLDAGAVRVEVQAQFEAFELAMGRRPDFLDGHQHVHQLPVIRDALIDEMQSRYGDTKPWIRISRGPALDVEAKTSGVLVALKSAFIKQLGSHELSRIARHAGIPSNQRLLGIRDFRANESTYGQQLDAWLSSAADGDLFMSHPSTSTDDTIGAARRMEFTALNGNALPAMLEAHCLQLLPMSQILGHPR